jgi:hypothetical protein
LPYLFYHSESLACFTPYVELLEELLLLEDELSVDEELLLEDEEDEELDEELESISTPTIATS